MLQVQGLTKEFPSPAGPLQVLKGLSLTLEPGQAASIMGPSGSGKSTLLSILGALDAPTSGSYTLGGENPYTLPAGQLAAFRNRKIGFIFQDHCLLPQCTVLENVLIPTLVASGGDFIQHANELLEQVGLSARAEHLPSQLSGGEKQRVAIARALILKPQLLLCDEPTGNLDRRTADSITGILLDQHARQRTILILVTHSERLAENVRLRFELLDGRLVDKTAAE
ncbi:MAG: ABC transporter ATP-binding protein [Acidobacteriia bacterium]|nr:ABC transporter ATP-binding protein [Terriglobia bacterium]